MAHDSTYKPGNSLSKWFDDRLPVLRLMHDQFGVFPMPRNLDVPTYEFISDTKIKIG